MKRAVMVFLISLSVMAAAIAGVSFLFPGRKATPPSTKPKVSATFFPVCDIAKEIAGTRIDVVCVLPSGASPHTFEVSPDKAREMQGSIFLFKIGGIDEWVTSAGKGITEVSLEKNVDIRKYEVTSVGDGEEGSVYDPHYWMTMRNAKVIARNIAEAYSSADPDGSVYYASNLASFESEADMADTAIRSALSGVKGKKIIAFHNAWSYFAEEYGLGVAASFEPSPGKEPSPSHLAAMNDIVKTKGIKVIFSEPSFSDAPMRAMMEDLGLTMYTLYPEGPSSPGASFTETMIRNAEIMAEALSIKR